MSFGVSLPHFTHIGSLAVEIWRLIDFQCGSRSGAILLPVSDSVTSLSSEGQGLSVYRQDNSIHGRDVTISIFEKQTSAILKVFFLFRVIFCIKLPNFIHIGPHNAEIWRNIDFWRWRQRFPICWCHCIQKIKVYQQTKFRRYISIYAWDITTSVLEKQPSAILEFYFRFWSRPFRRNLHQAAEFRQNQSTHRINMTSYLFL